MRKNKKTSPTSNSSQGHLLRLRKTKLSTRSGSKRERFLSTSRPVAENNRSDAADDAGMT